MLIDYNNHVHLYDMYVAIDMYQHLSLASPQTDVANSNNGLLKL